MRNGDIRNWVSPERHNQQPPPAPTAHPPSLHPRRRRIIESDDSTEAQQTMDLPPQYDNINQTPMLHPEGDATKRQPGHPAPPLQDIVLLQTSESDDMYVMNHRAPNPPQDAPPQLPRNRRASEVPAPRSRRTPVRGRQGLRRTRQQFEAAASESSDDMDDDSSQCIESDTNAQMQYREAIMGVRSARMARAQMRASTTLCPVCALFADFLAHFV